jgi:hypothetical protein
MIAEFTNVRSTQVIVQNKYEQNQELRFFLHGIDFLKDNCVLRDYCITILKESADHSLENIILFLLKIKDHLNNRHYYELMAVMTEAHLKNYLLIMNLERRHKSHTYSPF